MQTLLNDFTDLQLGPAPQSQSPTIDTLILAFLNLLRVLCLNHDKSHCITTSHWRMGDLVDLSRVGVLSIITMCFKWHHPPLPHLMMSTLGHVKWIQSNAGANWGDVIYSQVSVGSVFFDNNSEKKGAVFLMCLDNYFLGYSHSLRVSLYSERMWHTDRAFANTAS